MRTARLCHTNCVRSIVSQKGSTRVEQRDPGKLRDNWTSTNYTARWRRGQKRQRFVCGGQPVRRLDAPAQQKTVQDQGRRCARVVQLHLEPRSQRRWRFVHPGRRRDVLFTHGRHPPALSRFGQGSRFLRTHLVQVRAATNRAGHTSHHDLH